MIKVFANINQFGFYTRLSVEVSAIIYIHYVATALEICLKRKNVHRFYIFFISFALSAQ